jgi:hypothetical protein
MDLQMTRDVYGKNPPEPEGRGSRLPVIKAPEVTAVVKSEDLYVKADHWRGMDRKLTSCWCTCHADGKEVPDCGFFKGHPSPNWCEASPQE